MDILRLPQCHQLHEELVSQGRLQPLQKHLWGPEKLHELYSCFSLLLMRRGAHVFVLIKQIV